MSTADWPRVKATLDRVLDEPPDARHGVIERECGGDEALRAEVEALLREAESDPAACKIERFVRAAAVGPVADDVRHFGPYAGVRELGRGGMGTVYLARRSDGQFQQDVAVKVIRQTALRDDLAPQFLRERQILAGLNHPNIARLFDGGLTPDGQPYLVMEYVDGVPLLAHVVAHAVPLHERLRLFLRICDAVAHAHAKLVVHRDIKPSNVLVSAAGSPKLVDFGLARMLDDSMRPSGDQTVVGMRAFTPAYAAPEHMQGLPATTAGDIYSLGVVLYELLTGRTPFEFDRMGVTEMLAVMESTRPRAPSAAAAEGVGLDSGALRQPRAQACPPALLRGDIDMIVLKAIDADPERRYGTVRELADDVERHLGGRPVLASSPTPFYRARKFVRRHWAAVAASVVVGIGLASMLVVTLWQAGVARAERDRAARRFADVRRLANDLLFELAPRIERLPGATDARLELLQRALSYLDSLASETDDDPTLRRELAVAYEKIGDLQGNPTNPNLVDLDAAVASYEKAQTLRRRATEDEPTSRAAREALAENQRVLGTIFAQANEFERSTAELSAAAGIYRALAAALPADVGVRLQLARAVHDAARNESNTKRYAGSIPRFQEAIALAHQALALGPDATAVRAVLADSHAQLGLALSWEGRQREAEAHVSEAARIYETALDKLPRDVGLAGGLWSTYWVTSSVFEEQDDAKAHLFALKALDLARRAVASDGANVRGRQQLAKSLSRAGQTAINVRRPAMALGYLQEATFIWREIAEGEARNGRLRSDLALALTRLADAEQSGGRLDGALGHAREADLLYANLAAENPDDKRSIRNRVLTLELIGDIHARLGRSGQSVAVQRARDSYGQAVSMLRLLDRQGALAAADRQYVERLERKSAAP